jgi:hypothetical protein
MIVVDRGLNQFPNTVPKSANTLSGVPLQNPKYPQLRTTNSRLPQDNRPYSSMQLAQVALALLPASSLSISTAILKASRPLSSCIRNGKVVVDFGRVVYLECKAVLPSGCDSRTISSAAFGTVRRGGRVDGDAHAPI